MFSVAENSAAGTNVGTPVATSDPDGDTLTYTLKGASEFTIDADTGQIEVASGANLDYESDTTSYRVKVLVSDGLDENGDSDDSADDYVMVTINVTDVDEPPLAPAAPTLSVDPDSPKTALDVSWTAPDNTGRPDITDYDLRYRVENATGWTDHPVTGTTTSRESQRPRDRNFDYEVQVRATNAEGTGDWSDSGVWKHRRRAGPAQQPAPVPVHDQRRPAGGRELPGRNGRGPAVHRHRRRRRSAQVRSQRRV